MKNAAGVISNDEEDKSSIRGWLPLEEETSLLHPAQSVKPLPSSTNNCKSSKLKDSVWLNAEETSKKESDKKEGSKNKIRMPQRKGGLQLWQFLYALLEDKDQEHNDLIEWTHNRKDLEFRLNDPEAIALWWGIIKHRANMTYERLSRSLRYYYDRGILKKMGGERYLYRFCIDPEDMYRHIGLSDSRPVLKPMPLPVTRVSSSKMMLPPHLMEQPFYPEYIPPLSIPHHTHQLPPPPPYTAYPFHTPQYPSSQMNYSNYFPPEQPQDSEQHRTYIFSQPHEGMHSFNSSPLSCNDSNSIFVSHSALAVSTSSPPIFSCTTDHLQPEQERSLSTTDILSDSDSDTPQHHLASISNPPMFTSNSKDDSLLCSPEASMQFQYDCTSSAMDSGSGSELDEIIPLLESMEDTAADCSLPMNTSSPCANFTHYSTTTMDSTITPSPPLYITSTCVMSSCSTHPVPPQGSPPNSFKSLYTDDNAWRVS